MISRFLKRKRKFIKHRIQLANFNNSVISRKLKTDQLYEFKKNK